MEMPTTAPVEMPVWNWMPSMAETTEMAGVSTPAPGSCGQGRPVVNGGMRSATLPATHDARAPAHGMCTHLSVIPLSNHKPNPEPSSHHLR